jgi:ABC-2 type transport system permease protein
MDSFTGTWTLSRFILRRDRIRIPIWIIAFLITMVGTASIFPDTYPTDADRQVRATLIENPAMRIVLGPIHGTEDYTFGAMMASEMLGLTAVVVALMSIFMIVRHTRAEEESGRAELVRSSIVGRYAGMTAALIVTAAVNIAIGLTSAGGLYLTLVELDLEGSLLFGAAMAATGIVFAAITAVTVQINEFTRGASGMSIGVLGVTYVIRGFGDMLENFLSWIPPFGLTLQTAPYVDNRWWPILVTLGIAAILIPLAMSLSTRRDVAAALRPPSPGPRHASGMLTGPLGLVLRLQRGSAIAWGAGIVLFATAYGTMVDQIGEMYADNPMVADYFAVLGLSLTEITDSVISMFVMFFGMLASIFAVGAVTRLRAEETSLRAENVLATAVSRIRWASESLVFSIVASTSILLAAGLGSGLVYAADTGNSADTWKVVAAVAVYAPTLWLASAIAIAVFGVYPRAMALAWFVPAYGFFALMIGPLIGLPDWLYNLSPFEFVPRIPSADFDVVPLAVMTVIAAALISAGLLGIRRRDLDFV